MRAFERVHVDFFHHSDRVFLILVDALSGWVEIVQMTRTDAQAVISALRRIFLTFGDPAAMVSDNGPPFASAECKEFCRQSDIELLHSPPYHPQSNGKAERWVQTAKLELEKMRLFSNRLLEKVDFALRNTPGTDGTSPAQKIFTFVPGTQFEKLLPQSRFEGGVGEDDSRWLPASRVFDAGEQVFVRLPGKGEFLAR